jgi:fibronectin-binding autotransporter adhesin
MKIQSSLLLGILLVATPALAQTWNGGGTDNNWTTADNWDGTAPVATDPLTFSGAIQQINVNDFTANTIFESITLSQGGFTLSGNAVQLSATTKVTNTGDNTIALGLTPTSGAMRIDSESGTLTVSGNIGGTGGLTKVGTGTLFLTGNNAYDGGTTLNGGTLRLGSANALRTNNETALTFTSGTLDLNGFNATLNDFTLSSGSQILLGGGNLAMGLISGTRTFGGVISGSGNVTKQGTQLLILAAQQTYSGDTILVGGNIRNGIANGLPTDTVLKFAANANARRFQLQGFNQTLAGVDSAGASGTLIIEAASDSTSNAPATLTLNVAANESYNFGGLVRNAAGTATNSALTVVKNGEGTQIFSGNGVNNTGPSYSGTTTINAGILEFAGAGALGSATANNSQIILNGGSVRFSGGAASSEVPLRTAAITGTGDVRIANTIRLGGTSHTFDGSVILENGGRLRTTAADTLPSTTVLRFAADSSARRLQMQGHSQTLAGVDSNLATGGILIIEAAEDNASNLPATLTLNVADAQSFNFSGYLRDASGTATNSALSISKNGNGTQVFSGQSAIVNYTGSTTINGGVLEFAGNNSVANNSAMTVNAGGTVRFSGGGNRSTDITGAGSLEKAGDNVLTLSGTNTYTGNTIVNAGTLLINGDQSTATGAITVASGATLGGSGTIGGLTTINGTHSPGTSPGIQTFESGLTYNNGSTFVWELFENTTAGRGINYDGVNVTGGILTIEAGVNSNLVFNSSGSNVLWSDIFWDSDQSWLVFENANEPSILGIPTITLSADSDGKSLDGIRELASFSWSVQGDNIFLNYSAVPEPGTYALIGGLLALGAALIRRRMR